MKPTRIEDWPPAVRKQIEKQLQGSACEPTRSPSTGSGANGARLGTSMGRSPGPSPSLHHRPGAQTETDALALLKSLGMTFIAAQAPFTLAGGHVYTADLVMADNGCGLHMVEVKGTYRHETEGRSRVAFDQARIAYRYGGIWMKKQKARPGKDAHWRIEVFACPLPRTPSLTEKIRE